MSWITIIHENKQTRNHKKVNDACKLNILPVLPMINVAGDNFLLQINNSNNILNTTIFQNMSILNKYSNKIKNLYQQKTVLLLINLF